MSMDVNELLRHLNKLTYPQPCSDTLEWLEGKRDIEDISGLPSLEKFSNGWIWWLIVRYGAQADFAQAVYPEYKARIREDLEKSGQSVDLFDAKVLVTRDIRSKMAESEGDVHYRWYMFLLSVESMYRLTNPPRGGRTDFWTKVDTVAQLGRNVPITTVIGWVCENMPERIRSWKAAD